MSYPQSNYADDGGAAEKTNLPGIFLIIVGALNVLGAIYYIFNGGVILTNPALFSEQLKGMGFAEQAPGQAKFTGIFYVGLGLVSLIICVVQIMAGVKMRSLEAYSLAVTGAVLALIPCLSPMACCGLGEGIGIWALVVLMSADVKSAFR